MPCYAIQSSQGKDVPEGLYALFIPALKNDTGPAFQVRPHLVRLVQQNGHTVILRVFPGIYFREFTSIDDLKHGRMRPGLRMHTDRLGKGISISGSIVFENSFGYFQISLKGSEEEPRYWKGRAEVEPAPHFGLLGGKYRSEWCMQPAPSALIYEEMVRALRLLKEDAHGHDAKHLWRPSDPPRLSTMADYVRFLRSEEVAWPKHGLVTRSIERQFRIRIADELQAGRILLNGGRFLVSEDVKKGSTGKKAIRKIDINVTCDKWLVIQTTAYDPRGDRYRPPVSGRGARHLASRAGKRREKLLVGMDKKDREFLEALDYNWDELAHIPDIALLAEHMTTVPDDLKDKIAPYISDGSRNYFPAMTYAQLARVPDPVLLMACLPHMQAGQAKELAATARVKQLLDRSGLDIREIAKCTFPQLILRVLGPMPTKEAQALIDTTPKFREYLQRADSEELKALVRTKGLRLGSQSD